MKLFGIGFAILVGGAALYAEAMVLKEFSNFAEDLSKSFGKSPLITPTIIEVFPYICLAIMAFGVVWYWIVEPILYFRRRKES